MSQEDLFGNVVSKDALSPTAALQQYQSLKELFEATKDCQKCKLGKTRKNYVFGEGTEQAKLVVVGEAPGADEDETGRPFVGRSGELLNKILSSVKFERSDVYICNIVKSRPPQNRNPEPDEIEACLPYLLRQIELIRPKMILALGKVAANTLLENNLSMTAMRGKVHRWKSIDVVATYHPAALLRNPNWKKLCWEDVQMMRRHYDEKYGGG
ncbi:MAG: DNA polymerase [[Candidatus Thermochlorobacteriaceae] bacterium GBChlB]|nr:MAG: DNA polymerase [[Candidatus Thermochlorobacteriaceae] bacterium GBChlB]